MDVIAELGGIVDIGAGALLAFVVWMILTGRLVPRATVDMLEKWAETQREIIDALEVQMKSQNETVNPAIQRVLDALPVKPEEPRKGA